MLALLQNATISARCDRSAAQLLECDGRILIAHDLYGDVSHEMSYVIRETLDSAIMSQRNVDCEFRIGEATPVQPYTAIDQADLKN